MNKYIIDTGAICFLVEDTNIMDALNKVLLLSAFFKPSIYATYQPIVNICTQDLIVCNIGDVEVRVTPAPATINIPTESYYLSASFTCISH